MITFFILAVFIVAGAIGVITLQQPIHAALALVGTLLALAITYITLKAHFLAAIQVIVYAGAIMVLFLFVIMLLNLSADKPLSSLDWLPTATYITAAIAILGLVIPILSNSRPLPNWEVINNSLSGGGAAQIGEVLFSEFLLAFHLIGILLLTSIIAAVGLVHNNAQLPKLEQNHQK